MDVLTPARCTSTRTLSAASLIALLLVGAACTPNTSPGLGAERREQVALSLEGTLATVEGAQVVLFQNDGCRALGLARGQFSDGPATGCGLFPENVVEPFDADARATWSKLKSEFDDAGAANLQYAVFYMDKQGEVQSAFFEFGCPRANCQFGRLIYTRGGSPSHPEGADGPDVTNMPITVDWDWYEEDE